MRQPSAPGGPKHFIPLLLPALQAQERNSEDPLLPPAPSMCMHTHTPLLGVSETIASLGARTGESAPLNFPGSTSGISVVLMLTE